MHIVIALISLVLSFPPALIGAPQNGAPTITPVFTDPLDTILFIQNTQVPPIGGTLNSVARFSDSTLKNLKNSPVFIDDNGNVQLNGIIKNNNILSWPSTPGLFGQVLTSDGMGGLFFSNGGGGGGNVSTASAFTANDRLVRTDTPSGSTNVQQSGVTLDNSNNMSGLNDVTANTFIGNLNGNATSATTATTATTATNFTGPLSGDVTGTQSATVVSFVGGQSAANVASATVAANAATSANTPNTIVKRDGSGNFSAGTVTAALVGNVAGNATSATTATTATTATNFTGSLSGDVTGTQSATVVSFVGGQSAANVASATIAANAATSADTPNTIVKRDGSGNFNAGTVTAALVGNVAGNATSATTATTATTATNFTGPLSGDVTGTQSATVVSFVGGQTAANVASATIAANAATSANTPNTIVKRDGSGNFSAGTVTAALVGNVAGNATSATTATTATTATNFTGSLSGDVTGTQSATVVSFVGGQSAANVASATIAANAATSANTPNTIVKRDGSGNFSANTITATLIGSASLDVLKAGDTMTGTLSMANGNAVDFQESSGTNFVGIQGPSSVTSSYTLALPSVPPTAGQTLHAGFTTPDDLTWVTGGGTITPAISRIIYVATYGNDVTGNGSYDQPYASLAQAITEANSIATTNTPVTIYIFPGFYFENNTVGPLTITAAGITIFGTSQTGTFIVPQNAANTLLLINNTVMVTDVSFLAVGTSTATGVSCTASTLSIFRNVGFTNFATGISCGGTGATYIFETCLFSTNGTALANNNAIVDCISCGLVGASSLSGPPANTGITMTGAQGVLNITGGNYSLCQTCMSISNSSFCYIDASFLQGNTFDIIQNSGAQLELESVIFVTTHSSSDSKIQVSGAGSFATITGCSFNGLDHLGSPQGTAITVTNNAQAYINGGSINNYITGLVVGTNSDTSSTQLIASSLAIQNCTNDIIQNGTSTLNFNASVAAGNKIMLNNSTNVSIALFDTNDGNILSIGSGSIVDTPILQIFNGAEASQLIRYKNNLYGTQAVGFENNLVNPTSWYTASASATDFVAITTDRTQNSGLMLFSDTGGSYGGTSALRGWTVSKNGAAAPLAFAYQNSDTTGQSAIPQYTVFQLDGVNNQVQLPNAATQLVFDGDTNLYRSSASVLKTDDNFIVGTLTPGRAVITDPVTNQLASSVTTSTEVSYLSGVTSPIQTQLNNKVNRSGDTMTGTLQLPAGTTSAPALVFTGSTATGLSASTGNLSFSTNGSEQLKISSGGTISVDGFTTAGIVHNDASGNLSTSLIVNADISNSAAITDSKLATISTAGKVANSATTATSSNIPNTIVLRDSNGNFSASTITAALIGTVTGTASGNVPITGGTMTGTLVLPAGSAASPSLQFTGSTNTGISAATVNTLSFDTNGSEAMKIGPTGTITIDGFSGAAGVVHNGSSGNLSSSLIVDADITAATITNDKLANISSSNVSGDIVVRDGSGNFETNMITIDGTTTNPTDVATKAYVDSVAATGLQAKTPAVVVATSTITLSGSQTVDGVTLTDGDRVLTIAQGASSTTPDVNNGLWVVSTIGVWTRPTDFANGTTAGEAYVLITMGTVNAGSSWLCNTTSAVIGVNPIEFAEFSLPSQTTGANVGPGAGQVFQSKSGVTLNFRTIAAGTHMVVTNNSDNIALSTDATSANTASTIVARDASGNFSADTITATLVGNASGNLLLSGGSLTGALNMLSQNPINFYDAGNVGFVGIEAPSSVPSSYTLQWPAATPTASQTLQAGATTPTDLVWVTTGGSVAPASSNTIYVTKYGNDVTGNGSFDQPFASVAHAVSIANGIASSTNPVTISIGTGRYTENNSSPITISTLGITLVGEAPSATMIIPSTASQPLFSASVTTQFINLACLSLVSSSAPALSLTAGSLTGFTNCRFINFQTGASCSGSGQRYFFDSCLFMGNGTAISVSSANVECNNCSIFGIANPPGTPANTGFSVSGSGSALVINGGDCTFCATGVSVTSNGSMLANSLGFRNNAADVVQTGPSSLILNSCNSNITTNGSNIKIQISGSGASATIDGCEFNGNSALGVAQGTCLQVTSNASVAVNSCTIGNYTTGIVVGTSLDTSSTSLQASSTTIENCTNDITQNGTSTLNFNAGSAAGNSITLNNSTNVSIALFDTSANNILSIGSGSIVDTPILQIFNGAEESQLIRYKNNLYGTQAVGFENNLVNPTSWYTVSASATDFVAITTDRTQNSGLMLFSDTGGSYGGTSALRGWTVSKNGAAAPLAFEYQNSDTVGQSSIPQYTVFQLDGVNNQVQLPNAATQLVFDGDTNLYRSSASVLKTDSNFIVGPLTAGRAVITDPVTDQLASSVTTSTEISYLSGVTSPIQTQLNNKVNKSGDTMTGTLQLPAGTTSAPALVFTGSTTTGLSASSGNLSFSTSGTEQLKISSGGTISVDGFTVAGVVHNDASGNLSSSLIVNADVSPSAAIVDTKLATISTAGKVANSATTATSANTPNTIVLRDSNGNFSASTITATLNGSATGNVPISGGTMTGTLQLPAGSAASPSLQFTGSTNTGLSVATANTLSFDTNGAEAMKIGPTGTITIDGFTTAGIVKNDASGNLSSITGTNGQVLLGATGAAPAFATLTSTGNTLTYTPGANSLNIDLTAPVTVANGGTGATSLTSHSLLLGNGTSAISALGAATNGQIPIGSTGLAPVLSTITAGSNVTVTNGAGSITVGVTGGSFVPISGGTMTGTLQLPAGSAASPSLQFTGSTNTGISAGTANTLSFDTNGAEAMKIGPTGTITIDGFTTAGIVKNDASGNLSSIAGTNGQVLLGATGASPAFATLTSTGNTLTYTPGANSLNIDLTAPVTVANGGTGATSLTSHSLLLGNGTSAISALGAATNGQIPIGSTGLAPVLSTITAGSNVTVTNGAGSITVGVTGGSFVPISGGTMTGTLQLPAGSAASPSLQFTGSTNTGLSAATANTLSFDTNGVERMNLGSTGILTMDSGNAIDFQASSGGNFVGIQGPSSVTSSYTLALPTTSPTAGQLLVASASTPTQLTWISGGPSSTTTIYVAPNGNDTTGTGTFNNPYLTLSKAITVANGTSTATNPVTIFLADGTYSENNSAGALTITTDGISIVGASKIGTIISPSTINQNLLSTDITMRIENVNFKVSGNSTATAVSCTAGFYTTFSNVIFTNFQTGLYCEGSNSTYVLDTCIFDNNGTGLSINNATVDACNCNITGSCNTNSTPINTGITMTGSSAILNLDSSNCTLCGNVLSVTNSAQAFVNATNFTLNIFDILVNTSGILTIADSSFNTTFSSSDLKINVNGGTATINSCAFNGFSSSSVVQGSAIKVINAGQVIVNGGTIINYTTAITDGQSTDTSTTSVTVAGTYLSGNTTDISQNGTSTLNLDAAVSNSSKLSINSSTNVFPAYFDASSSNALVLPAGSAASPSLKFNGSTNTGISAATTNTLSFDTNGTERMNISSTGATVTSGVLALPLGTAASPSLKFTGSTNTGISGAGSANSLSFDTNGIERMSIDGSGNITMDGTVTIPNGSAANPSLVFSSSPHTGLSAATTDTLSLDTAGVERMTISSTGTTVTSGVLTVPAGSAASPSLKFTGSTNTGISAATANTLSFDTNGTEQMNISTSAINAILPLVVQNLLIMQAIQLSPTFPSSGSVSANAGTSILLLQNTTGSVTITVTFPPNPTNGQLFTMAVTTSNNVTISNVGGTGGATIVNGMTSLGSGSVSFSATGAGATFLYYSATNTWYRITR